MTGQIDEDRRLSAWLREGPTQLPDDVLRDVLAETHSIPQRRRRSWELFRLPASNVLRLASASAAGLVLLGVLVFNGSRAPSVGPGASASPSPAPSVEVTPSAVPLPSQDSSPSGASSPEPSGSPKTPPSVAPSGRVVLDISGVTHTESVVVGELILFQATIKNRGDAASAPVKVRFDRLADYAVLRRCTPACTTALVYGSIEATFATTVGAGQTVSVRVELQATAPGDVEWDAAVGTTDGLPLLAICHTSISAGRTLTPTIAPPPTNDNPPGDVITTLPFTDATNVARAEIHAMEPTTICGSGSKSVWYSYTAASTARLVADTVGSDYDTVLDIWRGSLTSNILEPGFETLVPLVCNDDAGSPQSSVVFAAQAGQSYVIRVLSKDGSGGNLLFHLAPG